MGSTFRGRALATTISVLALAGLASPAAARPLETVVQDDALLLHASDEELQRGLDRIRSLGIDRIRVTAGWSVIAPQPDSTRRPDFDATDPAAYPAGAWDRLDRIVVMARDAGLATMLDIAFWAPRWATRDPADRPGRFNTEIDAGDYARFATAVARRYSGTWSPPEAGTAAPAQPPGGDEQFLDQLFGAFAPPAKRWSRGDPARAASDEPLPAVDVFTVWNEPNHPGFLRPQWQRVGGRWVARSPQIYRELVRAAYPAIKAAAPGARVLIGGTSSMGSSEPGGFGVPPLRFLRELACVDADLRPLGDGACAGYERLPGDGWAHHPYSLRTPPDQDTLDPDKLPVAGTARLAATLRALVARGRLAPAVADVYMTEYGYETNGPDPEAPFALGEQARLLAHAEFIATSEPAVRMWPQFQLYDRPSAPTRPGGRPYGDWQSGLYFADGSPKPAAGAFATPAYAGCVRDRGRTWTLVWGRLRARGFATSAQVEARDRGGRWRTIRSAERPRASASATRRVQSGEAVRRYLPHRREARYRLRWTGPHGDRTSPGVAPSRAGCRPARRSRLRSRERARPREAGAAEERGSPD